MNIEKIKHSGMIVISDIINGYLFKRKYIGYTKKKAIKQFNQDKKESK